MDSSLKQRLVGATVLVALAVIFLPMLVKGPAPDSGVSDVAIDVPAEPKDADGMVTQDLPLVGPEGTPANGATGMPNTLPAAAAPQAPQDGSQPAVAAGDYAVGFGSYATAADADKVIAALKGAGLASYRETVTLAGRKAERVRIGPFADRAQAESARLRAGQVNAAVDAKVVVLDADAAATPAAPAPAATVASTPASAPATTPVAAPVKQEPLPPAPKPVPAATAPKPAVAAVPDAKKPEAKADTAGAPRPEPPVAKPADTSKTGYAVQVGAFSSANDATKLRDRLRAAGFNAFTDTVPTDKGTLTRVRVGPAMTRAEADTLKAGVQAKLGIAGMVRPHP